MMLCILYDVHRLCSSGNVTYAENIYDFDKPALGHIYVYLAVEGVVYMSLTLLMEVCYMYLCTGT